MIKCFPYKMESIKAAQILNIFMQDHVRVDFSVHVNSDEKITFGGKLYDVFKNMAMKEEGPEHSGAWYISQISTWEVCDLDALADDLIMMMKWLEMNTYVERGLPTHRFMKKIFLFYADD